jgi:hypothetical protein
VDH